MFQKNKKHSFIFFCNAVNVTKFLGIDKIEINTN